MKHTIITTPDPILVTPCQPVPPEEDPTRLVLDLFDSLKGHHAGFPEGIIFVGLAAPQIGILKRVCVIDVKDRRLVLVNPRITHAKGYRMSREVCLSQPGIVATVRRRMEITIVCDHPSAAAKLRLSAFEAAVAQHEIDHLDGILLEGTPDQAWIDRNAKGAKRAAGA